jgi:hypothetical protein
MQRKASGPEADMVIFAPLEAKEQTKRHVCHYYHDSHGKERQTSLGSYVILALQYGHSGGGATYHATA